LQGTRVELNGKALELGGDDALPALAGTLTPAGDVSFEPASITFLALSSASNDACR
jgi:heparanase